MRTISLRAIFLIGFVIAMPILALPAVARRLDDWLYGPPPPESTLAPLKPQLQQLLEPQLAQRASPASFDEIEPSITRRLPGEGLDAASVNLPPLGPLPAFPPLVSAAPDTQSSAAEPEVSRLTEPAAARLREICTDLERLGADYVVLETIDGSGNYRFHCDIRIDEKTRYSRPFEAVSTDPLAAAEQVLAEVSNWHAAARETATRQE